MTKKFRFLLSVLILIIAILACERPGDTSVEVTEIPEFKKTDEVEEPTPTKPKNTPTPKYTPTPKSTPTPSPVAYASVVVSRCNLRAGPGTTYSVIGDAEKGDSLPVYARSEDSMWILVDWEENYWIGTSLIELDRGAISDIQILGEQFPELVSSGLQPTKTLPPEPTVNETKKSLMVMEGNISLELKDSLGVFVFHRLEFVDNNLVIYTSLEREMGMELFYSQIGAIHGIVVRADPPIEAVIIDDSTGQTIEMPMVTMKDFFYDRIGWDEFRDSWIVVNSN
jgi:hypothetical protein